MNATRFAHHVLAGAVSAAILGGCSAGSQFAPSTASAGSQPVTAVNRGGGHTVSPDLIMMTYWYVLNGKVYWWYYNIWGVWKHGVISGIAPASNVGGSSKGTKTLDVATTDGNVDVLAGKKLVTTLTGLKGVASGVGTDTHGNTFAAVNAASEPVVQEFAKGATTPTATYSDPNLTSVDGLAIDKANRVYVEGQSQAGGIEVDELVASGSFRSLAQPGALGATSGGLAVQTSGKTTYVYINDLGNASEAANITGYEFDGKSLAKQGSFEYNGIDGAIAVDPSGKDTTHVYAVNNVAAGSGYSVTGVEYAYPSGAIVAQTPARISNEVSRGVWVK